MLHHPGILGHREHGVGFAVGTYVGGLPKIEDTPFVSFSSPNSRFS
jgi:hypothetical protein